MDGSRNRSLVREGEQPHKAYDTPESYRVHDTEGKTSIRENPDVERKGTSRLNQPQRYAPPQQLGDFQQDSPLHLKLKLTNA